MTLYYSTIPTPFGPFSVAMNDDGSLAATAFGALAILERRTPRGARIDWIPAATRDRAVREQISAYVAGDRLDFDLPLRPVGTPFQHRVWNALRSIPAGETRSYLELARTVSSAPRAVGRANALNPICLIVPCHRVIGHDGSLTGFAFGNEIKRRLLEHERARARARDSYSVFRFSRRDRG